MRQRDSWRLVPLSCEEPGAEGEEGDEGGLLMLEGELAAHPTHSRLAPLLAQRVDYLVLLTEPDRTID